jgi:hypothetical protein
MQQCWIKLYQTGEGVCRDKGSPPKIIKLVGTEYWLYVGKGG